MKTNENYKHDNNMNINKNYGEKKILNYTKNGTR